ncbi:MAG TPA: ferrous iron transport protein A [Solirubrobacterales bacterium]|nr:ferrous iron transport protein A [Solirubrobacterales bacterium]
MRAGTQLVRPRPTRLSELRPGRRARVVAIEGPAAAWCERLRAYGVVPGCRLLLVQHAPVTVVQVEHLDLAFEAPIAAGILVSAGSGRTSEEPGDDRG